MIHLFVCSEKSCAIYIKIMKNTKKQYARSGTFGIKWLRITTDSTIMHLNILVDSSTTLNGSTEKILQEKKITERISKGKKIPEKISYFF